MTKAQPWSRRPARPRFSRRSRRPACRASRRSGTLPGRAPKPVGASEHGGTASNPSREIAVDATKHQMARIRRGDQADAYGDPRRSANKRHGAQRVDRKGCTLARGTARTRTGTVGDDRGMRRQLDARCDRARRRRAGSVRKKRSDPTGRRSAWRSPSHQRAVDRSQRATAR